MKKAVNLRLDENIIITLEQLAQDLQATKTEVIEKAIVLFSDKNCQKQNELLQFAGKISEQEADYMLDNIERNTSSKDFELPLT